MQTKIIGENNLEVTSALSDYIFRRILSIPFLHNYQTIEIRLGMDNNKHLVKILARGNGKEISIKHSEADMYACIDAMADRVTRAMRRNKERSQNKRKHQKFSPIRELGIQADNMRVYEAEQLVDVI